MKLLQIGNARDMPVLVTSADDGIDTIMRNLDDGACFCLPKPIPESDLKRMWTYAYSKRKNKLAQVQKRTDDASGEKKPRLKWTGDLKKKAEESVSEAGGIKGAKANDILQRLRDKGIQDRSITTEKVNSYLQKERQRAKKREEGTIEGSTLKTESNQPTGSQPSVDESLDDMIDIYNELPSLDDGFISKDSGMFENYNEDDDIASPNGVLDGPVLEMMNIVSETTPSHTPKYEDKEGTRSEHVESTYEMEEHPPMTLPHLNTTNPNQQGFNLPLPVEANTSCTIGGQPFIDYLHDDLFDRLDSIDTGMSENYTAEDDIARDHSNGLLGSDVLTMEKISEMIPSNMPGYKDKEGTSSQHVESRNEMEEHPPMTLPHPNTTNPNQQGLNLPLPVAGNTSCTIGGQPFIDYLPDDLFDGLDSIDTGGILEDPSLSLPNEFCPVGIFENNTGNDIAHEHSNNLS